MQACPAGTYNGSYGLKSEAGCAVCPAGTGCARGSAEAVQCPAGKMAPNSGMAACAKCVAGKYQPSPGAQECIDCPAGSYCAEGATAPTRCPEGYYSGSSGESAVNVTACQDSDSKVPGARQYRLPAVS